MEEGRTPSGRKCQGNETEVNDDLEGRDKWEELNTLAEKTDLTVKVGLTATVQRQLMKKEGQPTDTEGSGDKHGGITQKREIRKFTS